jgi:uncharacterized protein YoxC
MEILGTIKSLASNLAYVEKNIGAIEKVIKGLSDKRDALQADINRIVEEKSRELSDLNNKKESFEKWIIEEKKKISEEARKVALTVTEALAKKEESEKLLNQANNANINASAKLKKAEELKVEYELKLSKFKDFVSSN